MLNRALPEAWQLQSTPKVEQPRFAGSPGWQAADGSAPLTTPSFSLGRLQMRLLASGIPPQSMAATLAEFEYECCPRESAGRAAVQEPAGGLSWVRLRLHHGKASWRATHLQNAARGQMSRTAAAVRSSTHVCRADARIPRARDAAPRLGPFLAASCCWSGVAAGMLAVCWGAAPGGRHDN